MTPEEQLQCINEEIRAYPRPIAGCDAQFNYLLERREELEKLVQPGDKDKNACS